MDNEKDCFAEQQRIWRKQRWIQLAVSIAMMLFAIVVILLVAGCSPTQKQLDVQAADDAVYTFIYAKVEGDDDLLKAVLTTTAQGILEAGRHPFPGDGEKMGERYEIIRYEGLYEQDGLVYEVKFYRPSTDTVSKYNVLVIKNGEKWKIASTTSVDEVVMEEMIKDERGIMIHEYESGEEE